MKASMAGDPGGELVVSKATRGTFRACCASPRPVAAATNRPAMRSRRFICPPCRLLRRNCALSYHVVRGEVCQGSQHLAPSLSAYRMSELGQKRKCRPVSSMAASPPKADIAADGCHVLLVPNA